MFDLRAIFVCVCYLVICLTQEYERPYKVKVEGKSKLYLTCEDLILTCKIHPVVKEIEKIRWSINGTNVTLGNRITTEIKDCKPFTCVTLQVKCVEETDAGSYSCKMTDSNESESIAEAPFEVIVHDPVRVVNNTGSLRTRYQHDQQVTLWCQFKGRNVHNITWNKKDELDNLPHHEEKKIDEDNVDSYLRIRDIRTRNGTYVCSASDDKIRESAEVHLFVLDVPHLTLHTATVMGARRVFMNWTLNDGNTNSTKYAVKYFTNSSNAWQFYNEEISGKNTSCIIRNLEPNTTYWFEIQPSNEIGTGVGFVTGPMTTLITDPHFVPEITIRSVATNSINIAWTFPPVEMKNHVHYFKLIMFDGPVREETVVHTDSDFSYAFTNLKSATTYDFQVAGCNEYTNECGNYSKKVSGVTLDGVSGPPENVTVTCKYDNVSHICSVHVSWSPPKITNGEIINYSAEIRGHASFLNEMGKLSNDTYGPKSRRLRNEDRNAIFEKLLPNMNYTVSLRAITRSRDQGVIASGECSMPPTAPDKENMEQFDWHRIEERGQWMFKLSKPKLSERNGVICCVKVFVVKLKPQQSTQKLPSPEENVVSSYKYAHENGGGTYVADMLDKDSINQDIVLGDGRASNSSNSRCNLCPVLSLKATIAPILSSSTPATTTPPPPTYSSSSTPTVLASDQPYSHYANDKLMADASSHDRRPTVESEFGYPEDGVLDKDSNYTGYIQLIVFGRDNNSIPAYSKYFTILQPAPQPSTSSHTMEFVSTLFQNISFQILCGMIAISIMMLAAFCLLRHYTKQVAEAQGVEMSLRNSFRHLCRSLRGSHLPVSSNPPDMMPISKTALVTTFAELAKDSDYGFEQEFEMLPDRFTDRTTKASEARENAGKNRYPDIKAYDQTRVKLSQIDSIIGSDYINANFVISYKERKKFICAQGPMENTVCDFWRMIWEQHLELVLMLTNLEEYSKTKCAKYWPDRDEARKTFNDITISFVNEKRYSDYVLRELKMVRTTGINREPEERSIFQYHFLIWKDFQAPEYPSGILKFIWRVNEAYSLARGPILVHCSAGVGRTGTLVAIDSLLDQFEDEGQVSIFDCICELRHQRNFLVQSLKQYIFVYRALVEYAQFGNTEIKASALKTTVEKLKQTDNGKMKTKLEEEYDKLSFTVSTHEHKTITVASAPENAAKNRNSSILPYDRNRVILTPIPGRDHSTYINASFIEGYDNSESFIITQDPIIDVTVVDFWRMVLEQNLTTVVMLSSATNDTQKKSGRYWPDDEAVYGNVNVKHIQSESCPYYTRREFFVSSVKTDENLVVTQYQYNGWPTVEGEVPEVTRGLIELMDHALQHAGSVGTGPLLVHCEYGSDRSSMFVALCILAQHLKIERRVDVVTTSRKLRSQRLGMLSSFAQYEFLYRAILNYVDLHHLFYEESE